MMSIYKNIIDNVYTVLFSIFIFYTVVEVYIVYQILFTLIISCFMDICCQMLGFCLTKEHLSTGIIHTRRAGILLPVWEGFTLQPTWRHSV